MRVTVLFLGRKVVSAMVISLAVFVTTSLGVERDYKPDIWWRLRFENWNFFDPGGAVDNSYIFAASLLRVGIKGEAKQKSDWQLELAQVSFWGLPDNAVAPAPAGDLGLGATYRRVNGGRDGSVFLKQAFWRWKEIAGKGSSLRLGRFEFSDGSERIPKDSTLSWLRRARIQHRLIGPFGFTHVQRSFDGLQLNFDRPNSNFTLTLMRPTRGAFDLKGNDQLTEVTTAYGSWTSSFDDKSDFRLFVLNYRDIRKPPEVVKVDNRPASVRSTDTDDISLITLGGHYLRTLDTKIGKADVLLWGLWQFGDWGTQDHKANAFALEIGHQWTKVKWKPWLRIGYFIGSGDDDPTDDDHKTFFQVLSTGRIYARTPVYNLMNIRDLSLQFIFKPAPKINVRTDWHRLSLANSNDLWYVGSGAFNYTAFGYVGRPSGGQSRLMDLLDLSVDYLPDERTTWSFYLGRAFGKGVVQANFPSGDDATFAYLELVKNW